MWSNHKKFCLYLRIKNKLYPQHAESHKAASSYICRTMDLSTVDRKRIMKKLFLNDRFILAVILLNCAILFLEEMGMMHPAILAMDVICILLFTIEMLVLPSEPLSSSTTLCSAWAAPSDSSPSRVGTRYPMRSAKV